MLVDQGLLAAVTADPLAAYPALAALLLASVAIASGLLRGDVLALARPAPVAWCIAAVAASWAVQSAAGAAPPPVAQTLAAAAFVPLAIVAVAYGPTPALVALALVHAWSGVPPYPSGLTGSAGPTLVALELALLGWLAIAPSPRRYPLLAGAYQLLAHALTWSTAGLAWIVVTHGDASVAAAGATHGLRFGAVAATAIVLALVPPAWWRRAFPNSALAPAPPPEPPTHTPAPVPAPAARSADGGAAAARDPGRMTGVWDGADLQPFARARAPRPDAPTPAPSAPRPFTRPPRRRPGGSRS